MKTFQHSHGCLANNLPVFRSFLDSAKGIKGGYLEDGLPGLVSGQDHPLFISAIYLEWE